MQMTCTVSFYETQSHLEDLSQYEHKDGCASMPVSTIELYITYVLLLRAESLLTMIGFAQ
jgi:hypothetical protein